MFKNVFDSLKKVKKMGGCCSNVKATPKEERKTRAVEKKENDQTKEKSCCK